MPEHIGTMHASGCRSEFGAEKAIVAGETIDRAAPSLWNHNEQGCSAPDWGPAY